MDRPPNIAKLPPKDRLRFWAKLAATEAKARAELAMQEAELEGLALTFGAELIDVQGDAFTWLGAPTEVVIAQRPELDEDLHDEDSDPDDDLWPVHVEKDLLTRIRATNLDLDAALLDHATARAEHPSALTASVAKLRSGERFVILTAADPLLGIDGTFVFLVRHLP